MKNDQRPPTSGNTITTPEQQQMVRGYIAERVSLTKLNDQAAPLESLIFGSATCLYEFFHSNGYMVFRQEWGAKNLAPAFTCQVGWVYAFYGAEDFPIYVGETGRTFLDRFDEHCKTQTWWPEWTRVKVLPCPNQSIRKVFESLIGLAGGYRANRSQPAGGDNLLDDVVLALLATGNQVNDPPSFPNDMILNASELVLSNLEVVSVNGNQP